MVHATCYMLLRYMVWYIVPINQHYYGRHYIVWVVLVFPLQTHFRALFMKRFRFALRDKKAIAFQLVIPIAALLVGLILLKTAPIHVPPPRQLSVQPYNDGGSTRMPLEVHHITLHHIVSH